MTVLQGAPLELGLDAGMPPSPASPAAAPAPPTAGGAGGVAA